MADQSSGQRRTPTQVDINIVSDHFKYTQNEHQYVNIYTWNPFGNCA